MNTDFHMTFSTDPEFMVLDTKKDEIISSLDVLDGDKHNPIDLGDGYSVFSDNILLEVGFPAFNSKPETLEKMREGFKRVANHLGKRYKMLPRAAHIFDEKHCRNERATVFGCDLEYDAELRMECPKPVLPDNMPFLRSCGNHIHMGRSDYKNYVDTYIDAGGQIQWNVKDGIDITGEPLLDIESKIDSIKLCDIFIGLPLTILDKSEAQKLRKTLYGRSSTFRVNPWGSEYRSPGAFWVSSPQTSAFVHDAANHVVELLKTNQHRLILDPADCTRIREAINTHNYRLSVNILKTIDFPKHLKKQIIELSRNDFSEHSMSKQWGI